MKRKPTTASDSALRAGGRSLRAGSSALEAEPAAKLRRRAATEVRELNNKREHGPMLAELYRRAESQLRNQQRNRRPKAGTPKPAAGPERLLHELQVHQIELEMQNTELQKARDELEVALEKYTDLYDFAPVGYFSVDESGMIQETNLTGAALLDVERSRLLKRPLQLFVAPTSRPTLLTFLKKVFTGAKDDTCDVLLLRKDGGTFWAGLRATPALSLKEAMKWCRVSVTDIAVRKRAEEMLHQNEAMFAALIAQAPIGVYVVDDRMCVQQVNPKALPVFRKVRPLLGRDLSQVMHILWPAKVADEVMAHFRHTLKTGQPFSSRNFSAHRHDLGLEESYEWHLRRVTLPLGQHGLVCYFNDITERKQAEETQRRLIVLTASNEKLEREIIRRETVEEALQQSARHQLQLSEQARQLSHRILHAQEEERKRISRELHDVIAQTLTSINVRLASLKREALSNTKGLEASITRTQHLVEHSVNIVHRFARELRPAVLDDLGLIPALHTFMESFKKETGIHVSLSAFAAVEQANGDKRTVLYRVAQEALTNVARHAQASRAEVTIQKLDGTICLEIKDDGKGFRAERVWHASKVKRLGLLGMKERVEMVGGNLAVTSAPGKGSIILAKIPLADRRAARGGGAESSLMETADTKP